MKRATPRRRPFRRTGSAPVELLEFDARSGLFELALQLVGLVALDALLDGLGGLVHEGLGLLEAQAGRRADDLDDLDLLVAGAGHDDVDGGGLLLGRCAVAATASRGGSRSRDRSRRYAELLLEGLDPLCELRDRDALELLDPFLGAGCHQLSPSSFASSADAGDASVSVGSDSDSGGPAVAASSFSDSGGSAGASPLTRPCSWICPSAIAIPDSNAFSVRTRPDSGEAIMPTSWPCITSRLGSRDSASISSIDSSLPSIQPPLNSGS